MRARGAGERRRKALNGPVPARRESEIQRAILQHCNRLPGVVLWRTNSGAVTATYKGKTRFVRFNGMPGMSDLIGWRMYDDVDGGASPCGGCTSQPHIARILAVEVKTDRGILTSLQHAFLDSVRRAGGIAIVARSVADVHKVLVNG